MRRLYRILTMISVLAGTVSAQTAESLPAVEMASTEQVTAALNLAMITVGVLLIVVIILALSIQALIQETLYPSGKTAEALKPAGPSWWDRFRGLAPSPGQQMDREIGHEYDGIQELDNDMPPWFKYLFYSTILFGIVYVLNYHVFKWNPLQEDEYVQEMTEAETELKILRQNAAAGMDENSVTLVSDPAGIESGKALFMQNCAACHGQKGEGMVGPNFTDQYWIHGGGIKNVFKVIKYGVPEKGMIAWQSQLSPQQMQEVASYILTLEGSNPPNAKEPQGEIWTAGEVNVNKDSTSVQP